MVLKKTGEQKCEGYTSYIEKGPVTDMPPQLDTEKSGLALLVTGDTFGKGNEELGSMLMANLFSTLVQSYQLPPLIVFMNHGALLSCEGSDILENLITLAKQGVEIITSRTCLEFYQIRHKLCVGVATDMYTILNKLSQAEKILTI